MFGVGQCQRALFSFSFLFLLLICSVFSLHPSPHLPTHKSFVNLSLMPSAPALSHPPRTSPLSICQTICTVFASSFHSPQPLCPFFPSISLSFIFFLYHRHSFSLFSHFFSACLAILCSPHPFISALLALMSVATGRSIQDGVFVLSAERKMNVAAMHHPLLSV